MTNDVTNVPELRFSEFNEEWEENTIENLLKERNERSGDGQMLSVTINDGIVKFNELDRKDNSSKDKSNYKIVRKNDIAYNSMRMWQGASGKSDYDGIVSPAYTVVSPFKNVNSTFIAYLFKTYKMIHVFKINSQGLTSDTWNLKYKQLKDITIKLPIFEEQEKIGTFFNKLDQQIELEEKKLAKLEEQKKGYMQKIFSQELRFKDENGNDYPNWIFEELNNIFTKYQNTIYLHDNEEYKRISISNKGKITHRDITFGKRIGRKRQYLIDLKKHPNTLTFIRQGVFLGGIGFIPSSLDGYIVTENMPLLSMSEEYSKKFMTYLFSSESYYKSVIFKNLPTGSAQKALHEKDWLKSFVNIPVYSEQEKIGNFFEKQDNLIKKQSDKVELLKERKKGFLQKMFV
ncbi:restriction endonuclease subunit S [Staphylococcus saprophyticus]